LRQQPADLRGSCRERQAEEILQNTLGTKQMGKLKEEINAEGAPMPDMAQQQQQQAQAETTGRLLDQIVDQAGSAPRRRSEAGPRPDPQVRERGTEGAIVVRRTRNRC
jgi:hypothetical protein